MKLIGFPRMYKEENEKRDFLPEFFSSIKNEPVELFLEYGYGRGMGLSQEDYLAANSAIKFTNHEECYKKDIVLVLRSPEFEELDYMKKNSVLVSMLHYPTRTSRVKKLKENSIIGISLDSIRNDCLERIVVNYKGTSGNGMQLAFEELSKSMTDFYSLDRKVINISIIGMGMVGLTAAKAARRYASKEINAKMKDIGAKGVLVKLLPRNITCDIEEMIHIIKETDILVDASTRNDTSKYIIENKFLAYLKEHAVILDLTADPYLTDSTPIQVKAIEGIPTGILDKTVIYHDDEIYLSIPKGVNTENRRTVVSCNAWPGVKPQKCMRLYGMQILPILKTIINNDVKTFSNDSDDYFVRAIYKSTLAYFEKFEKNV